MQLKFIIMSSFCPGLKTSCVTGIQGQRPNSKIYVDEISGHRYHFSTKRGTIWYVKCPERGCTGRGKMMVLDENLGNFSMTELRPHNHPPRKDFPLIADLKKRIKDRVIYESTDMRTIFEEECSKSDPEIAAKLDFQSMSSSLRKARMKFALVGT
uniref:Uncharacterized protein n=1 Tax=Lygus hesperus TaxID=30085 RepID=A0A146LT87_LYGHE